MIKWYDEIQKQIEEIQAEIDGIEAGEVDAKNLSEVLDKDAPIKLTTDLQNNKVKVGLDIDSETLEVEEGKLKVKGGGSGGTKKYLHTINVGTVATPYKNYTIQVISESDVEATDALKLEALLDTITPKETYVGNNIRNCVTPILNSTLDYTGEQLRTPIWIIKSQYTYDILYNTIKFTDNTLGYYTSTGLSIFVLNGTIAVSDNVTEL